MDFSVGLLICKSFIIFFLNNEYYIRVRWWYGTCCPASPHQYCFSWWIANRVQKWKRGIYPFFAWISHFCCLGLCWQSHVNCAMFLSAAAAASPFFFLIRWISKIVAVQKLVVFFKKKTNSFSNILWNCFIHSFIFKPNVSRVLLPSI